MSSRKESTLLCVGAFSLSPSLSAPPLRTALPIQVDEIRELTVLAKDAAGIMWEMVAMNEAGPAAAEMQANAQQLQVRA